MAKDAECVLAGHCGLAKMRSVQEHFRFQTQPGKFPTCGNLGQGVLLDGFPSKMGH